MSLYDKYGIIEDRFNKWRSKIFTHKIKKDLQVLIINKKIDVFIKYLYLKIEHISLSLLQFL